MYDTTKFWLPMEKIDSSDLNRILSQLPDYTEHSKSDGQTYFSGHFRGNYRVKVNENGVSLEGSLAKFYLSNNFESLTRLETERAIEKMGDELQLPINKAIVNRIDIVPRNIITEFKPKIYYPLFGESPFFKRFTQENSLSYQNSLKIKTIYDKIAETKRKRQSNIPLEWQNKNVLRYELRFIKRLSNQFNRPQILTSTLYEEKFYMDLLDKWFNEYTAIKKKKMHNLKIENLKSPKKLIDYLSYLGIESMGKENVFHLIEMMKEKGSMSNKEAYSRAKSMVRSLNNNPDFTEQSDLIEELDRKIKEVKTNY